MKQLTIYDSSNARSPIIEEFISLSTYWELILMFISRNITARYKRSVLGVLWTMLQPILMMAILTMIFSRFFGGGSREYAVSVLSGLLIWNLISEASNDAMVGMIQGGNLMVRIYVPKAIFAVSAVGSSLFNLVVSLLPLFLIIIALGTPIRSTVLFLPVSIALTSLFVLGLGLILSTMAVYFGDLIPLYSVILRAWFYLTPIIYPADQIPDQLNWVMNLNPAYFMVEVFREPILRAQIPEPGLVAGAAVWAVVSLSVGWLLFSSRADELPYHL